MVEAARPTYCGSFCIIYVDVVLSDRNEEDPSRSQLDTSRSPPNAG